MQIDHVDEPTLRIAALRRRVPLDGLTAFYDEAYGTVAQACGDAISGPAIGWYHGMPEHEWDVAAAFVVDDLPLGPLTEEVQVVELPGGRALSATHTGPYDELPGAWTLVEQARAERGVAGRGDFWEVYVTDPNPGGDPAANMTRLVLPLTRS